MKETDHLSQTKFKGISIEYPGYKKLYRVCFTGLILLIIFFSFINLLAILAFPFCLMLLFVKKGHEFDFSNEVFREFSQIFSKRKGKWKPLNRFEDLVILTKTGSKQSGQMGSSSYGVTGAKDIINIKFFELYLMDSDHRKRIFISSSESKKALIKIVEEIQNSSNRLLTKYNPVRLQRRRHR